jgi:hypothetical protein
MFQVIHHQPLNCVADLWTLNAGEEHVKQLRTLTIIQAYSWNVYRLRPLSSGSRRGRLNFFLPVYDSFHQNLLR